MSWRRPRTPRSIDYQLREAAASSIWDLGMERPLTDREREAAIKLEDEAAALRDVEREQAE